MTTKILLAACLLLPLAARAQTMEAPPVAVADGGGAAAYTVRMTYPASGAFFGGYTIMPVENIGEGGVFIDGFCMSWVDGGSVAEWTVEVVLADPSTNGQVDFDWFGCSPNFTLTARTLIVAPSVGNETPTWSTLKRSFR